MTSELLSGVVLTGVLNGGLYGLLGLAIVLVYRTTGVANFAQGDMGMFAAFLFLMVIQPMGLGTAISWTLGLAAGGALGGVVYLTCILPRPGGDHLNATIRTLGLYTLIYSLAVYLWGGQEPYRMPGLFGPATVAVGGFALSADQIGTLLVTVTGAATFFAFFRFTLSGLALRAVAIDARVAELLGVNTRLLVLMTWIAGGLLASLVGMLTASLSFLDTSIMRPYILKAFTAAVIGGLYSFPGVVIGGLVLGVSEAVASITISLHMREPFAFLVLLLVVMIRPTGLFASGAAARV